MKQLLILLSFLACTLVSGQKISEIEYMQIVDVKNWDAAVILGYHLVTDNSTGIGHTYSCVNCHALDKAGYPDGTFQIGRGGAFINGEWIVDPYAQDQDMLDISIKVNAPSLIIGTDTALGFDAKMGPFQQTSELFGLNVHLIDWTCIKYSKYKNHCLQAFGNVEMTEKHFQQAVVAFEQNEAKQFLTTKFQKWLRNEAKFNKTEYEGYSLFKQHCASCHNPDNLFKSDKQGFMVFKNDSVILCEPRMLYGNNLPGKWGWSLEKSITYKNKKSFLNKHFKNENVPKSSINKIMAFLKTLHKK